MRLFKTPNRDQLMLLPPNLNDWVRADHPARLVLDFVETLDLTAIYESYRADGKGQPPYDPKMMLAILLYAAMLGEHSSRKIERMLTDDLAFRFIAGNLSPDHDTIADFRNRHSEQFAGILRRCVQCAMKMGTVRLNHVAIDGTKMRANASLDANRSEEELKKESKAIEKYVCNYLKNAARTDEEEDREFGEGRNGYFLPDHLADEEARKEWIKQQLALIETESEKPSEDAEEGGDDDDNDGPKNKPSTRLEKKLEKLEKAKKALEEKEQKRKLEDPTGKRQRDNERKRGTPYVPQINVTDPDARKMLFREGGYKEGYNCQIAVDDELGIIVAAAVTQEENDLRQLEPMLLKTQENTGWLPDRATADTGYFNLKQMENPRFKSVEFFIPPRARTATEKADSKSEAVRTQLDTELGKIMIRARKTVVEPVFGVIKHARGRRRLSMRGLKKVAAEWNLICIAHNLLKLHKAAMAPA